ncbi:bifunctional metallophosphatase/5'-nucleotidase [Ornithinimicrobium sp. Y1847]|uniref:bifunctional metallophosphatase/5'-nucleotidase n=1 Tax=Ornithinimicrobium sp. Y1847 TaxID=3405419 RepID=UPI003B675069
MKRTLGVAMAAALTTSVVGTAAIAAPNENANPRAHQAVNNQGPKADNPNKGPGNNSGKGNANPGQGRQNPPGHLVDVQVLQFSDFHGHLTPTGGYGGAAYLAGLIDQLTAEFAAGDTRKPTTHVVASGDSIGGSTFASGLFQDEPAIEVLNAMGLQAQAVGNHEFDEGVDELMRMIEGGDHPTLGQFGDSPYAGTDFPYLAANVVAKGTNDPILPPYVVLDAGQGVKVGYIGVVTDTTPALVSPGGIAGLEFLDEATTINRYADELKAQGVEAIVALVHEGGDDGGAYPESITHDDVNSGCDTLTGEILNINENTTSAVDALLTGHTHGAFACLLPDPDGQLRAVNGPGDWGRVLSETTFKVNRKSGEVLRDTMSVENHVVHADGSIAPNAEVQEIVDHWIAKADVVGQQVIGSAAEPILGHSSGNRGIETAMTNFVADSILWSAQDAGAQIAFMNVGGVRASLEQGDITYAQAYGVAPFGNMINTITLTGSQIEAVLNQQYQPIPERGSRPMLALGVSEGFSYTWDSAAMEVVSGSMTLNGEPIDPNGTYRVAVYNFLAQGGDSFTVFTEGTDLVGGSEDLAALVAYIREFSPVRAPGDRVEGL